MVLLNRSWSSWTPGVLGPKQVQTLCDEKEIRGSIGLGESAFDVALGTRAWRLKKGAVKPNGKEHFVQDLEDNDLIEVANFAADSTLRLEPKQTYLVARPLRSNGRM